MGPRHSLGDECPRRWSPLGGWDSRAHSSLGPRGPENITTTKDWNQASSRGTQGACEHRGEERTVRARCRQRCRSVLLTP